jgi:hypothetical protein
MPFAFLLLGSMFVISGVRGTDTQLLALLKGDFTGTPNFISWLLAILLIGSLGYVEALRPLSRIFLTLVILVLLIHNRGFFTMFMQQIQPTSTTTTQQAGA